MSEQTTADPFEAAVAAAVEAAQIPEAEVAPPVEETPAPLADPITEPAKVAETPPSATTQPIVAADKFAPRLLKLMEREAAAVAREKALKEAEEKYSSVELKIKELEAAQSRFKMNPVDYIKKLAPDIKPADLAKALWYDELGDAAPIEHRAAKAERTALQTVSELRAEWEQEKKRAAEESQHHEMEKAHNQYIGALSSVAKAPPTQLELVSSFAKEDPERVTRGLYRMAQKHARATNGEVATPEQCAEMLEKELSSVKRMFVPDKAVAPTPAVQTTNTAPSSLRNKHTSVQPTKTAKDDNELFEEALNYAREVRARQQLT